MEGTRPVAGPEREAPAAGGSDTGRGTIPPGPRPVLPLWAALVAAALGGPILDAAYPALGWWPLSFVGVALCLVPLIGRRAWSAVLVGAVFGGSFYFTHIVWITRYLGALPWFGLAGLETVFWAFGSVLITWAYRWLPRVLPGTWAQLTALPVLVAGMWTFREVFMGAWPYTGFPWARLGMSQSESPLAHLSSWVGVSGLTFLMVMATAAVIEWVRVGRFRDPRTALSSAGLIAVLLLTPAWQTTSAGTMRVGSVQGNGPTGYFDEREPGDILRAQLTATAPLLDEDLDLLLWPEGAVGADPSRDAGVAELLDTLALRVDAPVLLNAATERDGDVFNTSMIWEPGEGLTQYHDKRTPVPFGEYVPERWFFEAIVPDLVGLIQREYTPGANAPYVDAGGAGIGLAICFDVIYDDVIREGAREGAQVYMFQTNNADFRDTDENLQQLAFARMRAIETGRSVVNISTVGTSQVISPSGRTIDSLPADVPGAMVTEVELRDGLTPAVVIGGVAETLLSWGSLVALVSLGILARTRRAQDGRGDATPRGA